MNEEFIIENHTLKKYTGNAETVIIPDGVTHLGECVLSYRDNLKRVILPDSVTSIDDRVFRMCQFLKEINLPESLTSIGNFAFDGCTSLKHISIPPGVKRIGTDAFDGTQWLCDMQKQNPIVIVNGILLDVSACHGDVTIPEGVTAVSSLGRKCHISGVKLPSSVRTIGYLSFFNSGLTEIILPEGAERIEEGAFASNFSLEKIIIPGSVKYFGENLFANCFSWLEIIYDGVSFPAYENNQLGKDNTHLILNMLCQRDASANIPKYDKLELFLQMLCIHPDDDKIIDCLKEDIMILSKKMIDTRKPGIVHSILHSGRLITSQNIDELILYAIERKSTEIQLMLMDYKANRLGYDDTDENIRKKFTI